MFKRDGEVWGGVQGYKPYALILPRGWLAFRFKTENNASSILKKVWRWNSGVIFLK